MFKFLPDFRLNTKIALLGTGSVLVTAITLVLLAVWQSGQYNRLAQREVDKLIDADLNHITQGVYNLVQTENDAVQQQLNSNLKVAHYVLTGAGGVSLSQQSATWTATNQFTNNTIEVRLPTMLIGGRPIGYNTAPAAETIVVDQVSRMVGETATIFQRMNDNGDMLRVATSVKTKDGQRAIGTYIPAVNPDGTPNPVISAIRAGNTYHGRAYVVNAWYLTAYEPIKDTSGKLVGMLYVGVKQSNIESRLRQAILKTTVARSGYVYVLSGKGANRGRYVISQRGEQDGENILESSDNDVRTVVTSIINTATALKAGELATQRYRWQNPDESALHWKITRLAYYEPWDWVIGATVDEHELQAYRSVLSNGRVQMTSIMGMAGLAIALLIGLFGVLIAWTIARPVCRMKEAVETIIGGKLDQIVEVDSRDEIGALAQAFNHMTERLNIDNAERTRAEEKLLESQKRLSEIIDFLPDATFAIDREGKIIAWNQAIETMTGFTAQEMMGKGEYAYGLPFYGVKRPILIDLVFKPDHEIKANYSFVKQQGDCLLAEANVYPRGELRILWGIARHLYDCKGNVVGAIESIRDITDRKRDELTIREANERFRSVMRAATAYSIIGTDPDGIIHVFNEGAELMLGYTAEEVIGKATPELIHDPEEVAARAAEMGIEPGFEVFVAAARLGGNDTREWTYIRKDGSRLTVSLTITAMRSESGMMNGFIGLARDITGEKQMEQQLHQSQKLESIGRLAGGVAHDFNNMLGIILGAAQLSMPKVPEGSELWQNLNAIKTASERSRDITRQLLAFSRKEIISPRPVNLNALIIDSAKNMGRLIGEDVKRALRLASDLWTVMLDPSQLDQILMNLSVNAHDAMPDGGLLTIATSNTHINRESSHLHPNVQPGDYVQLTVSDTGCGMDRVTREHIFEPFFTTKGIGKGTGLGLSTVYGIVSQNNGFINVESEPGEGTTFRIYLPRVVAEVVTPEQETLAALTGSGTILLVEDEEMLLWMTTRLLEEIGYRVIQASTPHEALAICSRQDQQIDLTLTDVVMPEMNGRELAKRINLIRPEMKVLFMSGYTADIMAQRGILESGMQYIQKPLDMTQLNEKICAILRSSP